MPQRTRIKKILPVVSSFVVIVFLILQQKAYADAIWQSVLFEGNNFWLIPATLIIEYPAVYYLMDGQVLKAVKVTCLMNVASFIVGVVFSCLLFFVSYYYTATVSTIIFVIIFVMFAISFLVETWVVMRYSRNKSWVKVLSLIGIVNFATTGLIAVVVFRSV